jgi:hypothetical protein
MSEEQPMPTAMTLNTSTSETPAAKTPQEQQEVMRLRGGGNTFADCLAYPLSFPRMIDDKGYSMLYGRRGYLGMLLLS